MFTGGCAIMHPPVNGRYISFYRLDLVRKKRLTQIGHQAVTTNLEFTLEKYMSRINKVYR